MEGEERDVDRKGRGKVGTGKVGIERRRLRGNEKYRELRKGQGREVEGEGKKKVK